MRLEKDVTKTTLQHIKSVLSTIFTCAKNEGAFDGANPVDGVLIPWNVREPGETHAYDLDQVLQILDLLPLLAKSLIATAAFAGLRRGELRGLEWTDYTGTELKDQPFDVEIGGQPSENTRQPRFRADNSCLGGNPRRIPKIRG
jgi:integrase